MEVYVAGPLQASADLAVARQMYESIRDVCLDFALDAYLPHEHADPELHEAMAPRTVFTRDVRALRSADLVIAHIGPPSSGVGAELGLAFAEGMTVVGIHHRGESPSKFILGLFAEAGWPVLVLDDGGDRLAPLRRHLARGMRTALVPEPSTRVRGVADA